MSPGIDQSEAVLAEELFRLGCDLPGDDPDVSSDPPGPSRSSITLRRAESALWRSTRQITVALSCGSREAVVLNGAGSEVWALLDRWQPFTGLCATLAENFGVSEERIAADLAPVLTDLVRRGLVVAR